MAAVALQVMCVGMNVLCHGARLINHSTNKPIVPVPLMGGRCDQLWCRKTQVMIFRVQFCAAIDMLEDKAQTGQEGQISDRSM